MTVDFEKWFIVILICFFSLLCYLIFFYKPKVSRVGFDLPPRPPSLPIIGHLHLLFSTLTHKSLQRLSFKYGPLLHLSIFNVPVFFVSSPSLAYEIFKAHDVNISNRGDRPAIDESLLVGSFSFFTASYGDYWKFMKKLLVTKLLGPQALQQSRSIRADELERFYTKLHDKAMKKESVQIGMEAMKLTNNIIFKMIVGRGCSEENDEAKKVRELVIESTSLTKKIFLANILHKPLKKLGLSLFKKEIMDVSCRFDEVLERIIEDHVDKPNEGQDAEMLNVLLAAYQDKNAEYKITRNHIKSLFVDLLVAGTDTSRHATQWTMAEIINNQKVFEKLREEIDSIVGKTRLVRETDLPNLPYLQAVVKEGLRLHPPGPLFARTAREECRIREFYVPKNTPIIVNAYAVMRDPVSWQDPNEFNPERFLEEEKQREQALKYIPFGSGRRGCPGSNLAYIIIGTAIGMMVQSFDWKTKGDKVNMEEAHGTMVLTMAHPLNCIPVARTSSLTSKLQIPSS